MTRKELTLTLEGVGGRVSKSITKKTDYLIVGADGSPCWTFSCYGRKVEQAVIARQSGSPILIVHEYDFWDALMDA